MDVRHSSHMYVQPSALLVSIHSYISILHFESNYTHSFVFVVNGNLI